MKFSNLDALRQKTGLQLPASDWITVTQQMINDFAQATGDHQWIHVDEEKAAQYAPFGCTIAHGFLSVSLFSRLLNSMYQVEDLKLGINYGLNKVRFPAPVPVNSRVRLQAALLAADEYGDSGLKVSWECALEIEHHPKPACVGEWVVLLFE
ncbi:MAG: MaoC family dehydratase [Saprospiraceae bacterium]|nr:MaoC family dehydratase [Lewinella sp.]